MTVEAVYLAWNRRQFTEASFRLLHRNTNWDLVDRLVVYDDGSEDGTDQWLEEAGAKIPVPGFEMRRVRFRSPPATMNDAVASTDAEIIAKIDNDIALPPGWLDAMLGVMQRNPWVDALGMEAARTGAVHDASVHRHIVPVDYYGCESGSHIGGVGLIRTRAITKPIKARGRQGWTEYQANLDTAWITPDLPVVQLDLIPEEPWVSLAAEYVKLGYARRWTPYDPLRPEWWSWIREQIRLPVAA